MTTALIVIDIQNDYFPAGNMELSGAVDAAQKAASLIGVFRKAGLPIFHIQHISKRPNAGFLMADTFGVEFHQLVKPLISEPVIKKHYPNSFRETGLDELLRERGVQRLFVCGMMTHMCVDTTVRAGFDLGYEMILAHDGCATKSLTFNGVAVGAGSVQASYMAALGAVFAKVVTAGEALLLL